MLKESYGGLSGHLAVGFAIICLVGTYLVLPKGQEVDQSELAVQEQ